MRSHRRPRGVTSDYGQSVNAVRITEVDPGAQEAQHALARYFDELASRFPSGFDAQEGGADEIEHFRPPDGSFLLVTSARVPIGCGGIHRFDETTSEIKRMWIDPAWRGRGLGRRLLDALEGVARESGHRRIVLDTNESLIEAIAMYERAGYHPVERYNDNPYAQHWFAKSL